MGLAVLVCALFSAPVAPAAAADFSVDPESHDFGGNPIESIEPAPSSPRNFRVTNAGLVSLSIATVTLAGPDADQFVFSSPEVVGDADTCSAKVLLPGQFCDVSIQFDPQVAGVKSAILRFTHDGAGGSSDVPLTGRGTLSSVLADPLAIAFPSRNVDLGPAEARTVTITNTGAAKLTFSAVPALIGPDLGEFRLAAGQTCVTQQNSDLEPGASCTAEIGFDPATVGAKTASLRLSYNGPLGLTDIALTGSGTRPAVSSSSAGLTFSPREVASGASDPQTVTITNVGLDDLEVTGVSIVGPAPGDFAVTGEDCTTAGQIAPVNGSCSVDVAFDPTVRGPRSAALQLTHNPANAAGNVTTSVTLSGAGSQPEFGVYPAEHVFAGTAVDAGPSVPQFFRVENVGSAPMRVGTVALTGANPGEFVVASEFCTGRTLAPDGFCDVEIVFDPSSTGAKTASLHYTHDAPGGASDVPLSGTGTVSPPDPLLTLIAKLVKPEKLTKLRALTFSVLCPRVVCSVTGRVDLILPRKGRRTYRSTLGYKRVSTAKGSGRKLVFKLAGGQRVALARAAARKRRVSAEAVFTAWSLYHSDNSAKLKFRLR
ncbi:MAG: choice-of-anchor D domain-containing protein [Solirubrobacterales bacterium]